MTNEKIHKTFSETVVLWGVTGSFEFAEQAGVQMDTEWAGKRRKSVVKTAYRRTAAEQA